MKLLRDEMVRAEDTPPLELFVQGIRTEVTRQRYLATLKKVLCEFLEDILEGTFEERAAQLVKYGREDPDWTRDLLIILSRKLRRRTGLARDHRDYLNPATFGNYFKPVKKLFDMNDVVLSWGRVYSTYPELDNVSDSAGWTREDMARMLIHARDVQDRVLVLVLASSGVRAGALDQLSWEDLSPVYRVDGRLTRDPEDGGEVVCAALEVYRGSPESYTTFVTPEAFAAIREYGREWTECMGRQAGPKDPIFLIMKGVPQRASIRSIRKRLEQMVAKSGLRDGGKEGRRYRVPMINGFRRFFNKTCKEAMSGDSTLGSLIKHEYMMGHHGLTSLDENYFKTDVLELAADYVKVVPDLTIDDADRLRLSNRMISDNLRKVEGEKDGTVARMREEMGRMRVAMERMEREKEAEMARVAAEKDSRVERMEREIASLKRQRNMSADELLAAVRDAPADGVPAATMESLIGMVEQLGKAQNAAIEDIRNEYNDKMDEMRRAIKRMAREGGMHGPAGFGEGAAARRR